MKVGSRDEALHFSHVALGREVATIVAPMSGCRAISTSRERRCLAPAGGARTIKLWLAPSLEEVEHPFHLP